ncbi:PD-(D/E)XK nuclease family protein [Actinomyces respiraculi]|uniref:PD-(D/E)XK nuclease family protein n=1 Tax=Actinomyces respiraculi TaxID=2744574 RepID=UPI0014249D90|nr:PD-(D/E)XK nuclease family protein [Actinomyces respiraculi]
MTAARGPQDPDTGAGGAPTPPAVRLLPAQEPGALPGPDPDAAAVLARAAAGEDLVVLGAPGTGRSTLALHLLTRAVADGRDALLLAPTRSRADLLRTRAAQLLAGGGGGVVRVRTPASYAFTVLSTFLTARADPLPAPVLLAGAEEDAALASLLRPIQWPGLPAEAVGSRAFRTELRNLLARAGELGVTAEDLADWGCRLDVPLWGPASELLNAWDAQGRASAERRSEIRKMDSARIQDRAIEALVAWESDGVTEPRPVPDLVIVDDYQDCTAATARLLVALARPDGSGHRAQVVVLGDPDVAVETFRGGTPSLLVEAEDRTGLGATRMRLGTRHRGTPALVRVWEDQAARLPVTGTASHRRPQPAATREPDGRRPGAPEVADDGRGDSPGAARAGAPTGVEVLVAGSEPQETAHVARLLRAEHIHHGTGWEHMAVILRSAGRARAVARELRRRGVPLASTTPAVLLRAEPAAAALLAVADAALDGRLGDTDAPPERPSALDLLTSPLIGLSILDLRRLRRHLRAGQPAEQSPDEHLLAVLSSTATADALARALHEDANPLAEQADRLARAAAVVAALRQVVRDSRDQDGGGHVDAEHLLWRAWDASGRAEAWRERALDPAARTSHGAALLAEAAEHDLDVVTALFKRAEVWAERHPGAGAADFLAELAAEVLPSDSVAPQGVRPAGVSVLTPAAAVGREWEVVAVMGLGRDTWPDLRLRDTLTRSGLLVDAVTDRLPLDADGHPTASLDAVSARAEVRADERRMLLAALTRARRRLLVTAVSDEENAPSSFLLEVAHAAGARVTDADGHVLTAPEAGDLTLRGLVGELRQALVTGHLPGAGPVQHERARAAAAMLARLAAEHVPGASPSSWLGVAGPSSSARLVAEGERVRVSPSDVEALNACPLKWFLQRNGAGSAPSKAQDLGTLVHDLAEEAQRTGLRGDALTARFEELLPSLGYPDTWMGGLETTRAREIVERLGRYLDSVPGPVDVEQPIRVDLDLPPAPDEDAADGTDALLRLTLAGRIDRLEHLETPNDEHPRVRLIDLKTGKHVSADPARHPQLAAYRLALEAAGYEVTGAALVLLGKDPLKKDAGMPVLAPAGAALDPSPDPDTGEDWARRLLTTAAKAASAGALTARTGEQCRTCAVKDSCPVQSEGRRTVS